MSAPPRAAVRPFGEASFLVELGDDITPELNDLAIGLVQAVAAARTGRGGWLGTPVAGYASVLVPFDATRVEPAQVEAWLHEQLAGLEVGQRPASAERLEIPVRYGGEEGPDLADVARRTGLSPADVIDLHRSVEYRVYMLGFAPGFAYLGQLPAELDLPRRDTPRQRVPAGSVAIAARQTAVYPLATPAGWHVIGRTAMRLWDVQRQPPAVLQPGATVRFIVA